MTFHAFTRVFGLALALAASSCSEPTYPASGIVRYRTGQTYKGGGTIQFESTQAPYPRSMSDIQPDGTFNMTSHIEGSGALAGEQRVCIIPYLTVPLVEGIARQRLMDPKYCAFQTSGLKVNVDRGTNQYVIEIDPPPGVVLNAP